MRDGHRGLPFRPDASRRERGERDRLTENSRTGHSRRAATCPAAAAETGKGREGESEEGHSVLPADSTGTRNSTASHALVACRTHQKMQTALESGSQAFDDRLYRRPGPHSQRRVRVLCRRRRTRFARASPAQRDFGWTGRRSRLRQRHLGGAFAGRRVPGSLHRHLRIDDPTRPGECSRRRVPGRFVHRRRPARL
jgi:hypothetical protein